MPYGNHNPAYIRSCQFLTFDGTSDASTALGPGVQSVDLYAGAACWVHIAPSPVAVKPSAEKVKGESFFIPATGWVRDIAVPLGDAATPIKIAAVQDTAGGNLYIYERKES